MGMESAFEAMDALYDLKGKSYVEKRLLLVEDPNKKVLKSNQTARTPVALKSSILATSLKKKMNENVLGVCTATQLDVGVVPLEPKHV